MADVQWLHAVGGLEARLGRVSPLRRREVTAYYTDQKERVCRREKLDTVCSSPSSSTSQLFDTGSGRDSDNVPHVNLPFLGFGVERPFISPSQRTCEAAGRSQHGANRFKLKLANGRFCVGL